jgi:hypothetical protein
MRQGIPAPSDLFACLNWSREQDREHYQEEWNATEGRPFAGADPMDHGRGELYYRHVTYGEYVPYHLPWAVDYLAQQREDSRASCTSRCQGESN